MSPPLPSFLACFLFGLPIRAAAVVVAASVVCARRARADDSRSCSCALDEVLIPKLRIVLVVEFFGYQHFAPPFMALRFAASTAFAFTRFRRTASLNASVRCLLLRCSEYVAHRQFAGTDPANVPRMPCKTGVCALPQAPTPCGVYPHPPRLRGCPLF